MASREDIYKEIRQTLGLVPSMFKAVPDSSLEAEWRTFKAVQLDDGPVPQKYRELLGIALSAATKCRYCALFHTEAAKLNGATPAEIEHAVHFAKASAGWSTYIHGLQIDFEEFRAEVEQIVKYLRKGQK